ncbi:DNA-protecting protein DprA [Candidatus Parcubacteria bacterium]|nr:MAG: DNA-protecting protein DprA [Candidatus Parcubacteria bacterium]
MSDFKKIHLNDPSYPSQLKEIHNAPKHFFLWGNADILTKPSIAIVGTRRASEYGKEAAYKFAADLAQTGLVIVSGMARGIDEQAHKGALFVKGKTIGVIGSGMDEKSFYPSENYKLAKQIVENGGAVLSEHEEGVPAMPHHFPLRNRIVSGLSLGVLVIEAKEKSGALLTAEHALNQNRDVFAIPGPIYNLNSQGPNKLIQQGAKLVSKTEDILEEFPQFKTRFEHKNKDLYELSHEEKIITEILKQENLGAQDLAEKLNQPIANLLAILSALEIKGVIVNNKGLYRLSIKN